jgi:hypothetical protein
MISVSAISTGGKVPVNIRAMPSRKSQILPMIKNQNAKSGTAAVTPKADRRIKRRSAAISGAI